MLLANMKYLSSSHRKNRTEDGEMKANLFEMTKIKKKFITFITSIILEYTPNREYLIEFFKQVRQRGRCLLQKIVCFVKDVGK